MRLIKYLVFLAMVSAVAAQPPPPGFGGMRPGDDGPMRQKIRERIKTMKVWRLTDAVGLTTEQSEKFFPVYNKFQDQLEELEQGQHRLAVKLDSLANDPMSKDDDIKAAMAEMKQGRQKMVDTNDAMMKEVSGILSVRQQGKLMAFEERFRRELQELINEIRRNRGGRRMND